MIQNKEAQYILLNCPESAHNDLRAAANSYYFINKLINCLVHNMMFISDQPQRHTRQSKTAQIGS